MKTNKQNQIHNKRNTRKKSEEAKAKLRNSQWYTIITIREMKMKKKTNKSWRDRKQKDAKPQNVDENISVLFIDEHARSVSTETGQVFAVFQSFWTLSSRLSAGIARHDDDNMSWPNVKKGY